MAGKLILKRVIAVSIDMLIIGFLDVSIVLLTLKFCLNNELGYKYLTLSKQMRSYAFLINLELYFIISEALFSTTIGKNFFGLRIVNNNCEKPSLMQIFVRNIFRITDQILAIGSFTIFFDNKRRRLGDIVSKTLVVDKNDIRGKLGVRHQYINNLHSKSLK